MSNILDIGLLKQENDSKYNIDTKVQLTDTISVTVRIKPSDDIIAKVIKNFLDVLQTEETADLTKASAETVQYFVLASLLKETTDINVNLVAFEDYTDMIVQLVRAGYLTPILSAFGDDLNDIIQRATQQMNKLTEVLVENKKEIMSKPKAKTKATSTRKPRTKNKKEEVVDNGEQQADV
jgi:hypothetical protein